MPINPTEALKRLAEDFTAVNDRLKQLGRDCEDFVDALVALAKHSESGRVAVVAYEAGINKTGEAKNQEEYERATETAMDAFQTILIEAEKLDAALVGKYKAATGEVESIITTYEQVYERIEEVVGDTNDEE